MEQLNRDSFRLVGIQEVSDLPSTERPPWYKGKPLPAAGFLLLLILGCLFCEGFIPKDPSYMDLTHFSLPPGKTFWFGTDTMGRDIFSMVWYGGRISLLMGVLAAAISALIAVLYGAVSGMSVWWMDSLLMRLSEILLSIPGFLFIIFIQAALGKATIVSIAAAIGSTGWMTMANVVRTEVRQLKSSEYLLAAQAMGGGFFYLLRKHLLPNLVPSLLFMVIMNLRNAIMAEATLSFMGLGLPLEVITWGSMLSLSGKALLSGGWWMILIPGAFLVSTLFALTSLGNYLRKSMNRKESNL